MKMYNTFQNAVHITGEIMKVFRGARVEFPVRIVLGVLSPLLATLIPSVAIALVMEKKISTFMWVMMGVLVLAAALDIANRILERRTEQMAMITRCGRLFERIISRVLRTEYANVEPHERQKEIGKAVYSISNNWQGPEQLARVSISFVVHVLGIVSYGSAILLLDVRVFLITMVMFVLNYFLCRHACNYWDNRRSETSENRRKWRYLWNSALTLEPGKDVRVFQMEKWFHKIGDLLIQSQQKLKAAAELRWYYITISDQLCICARDLLAYGVLLTLVLDGRITVAMFTLYIGIIAGFSEWMNTLAFSVSTLRRSSHEYNDYRMYMDSTEPKEGEEDKIVPSFEGAPEIEFDRVSFHYYEGNEDVIHQVSFKLHPGEKLAIVGNNGAGKTTLIKLLCGLYQPSEGVIRLNGVDIQKLQRESYCDLLSILFQDLNVMAFTIAMNVSGTRGEKVDEERVWSALKRAGLYDKVKSLPDGIHTFITQTIDDKGIQLSGGETQKLLLARAIYKNGPILILDEPTSALDPLAESRMYEEYNRLTKEKTSIFISHRLASTKFCNRILYLEDGIVVEKGTHEELLAMNGKYANMFEIQSHYYKEGGENYETVQEG